MPKNKTSQAAFDWLTANPKVRPEDVDAICKKYKKMEKALKTLLQDDETGKWGADVTMIPVIKDALSFDPLANAQE